MAPIHNNKDGTIGNIMLMQLTTAMKIENLHKEEKFSSKKIQAAMSHKQVNREQSAEIKHKVCSVRKKKNLKRDDLAKNKDESAAYAKEKINIDAVGKMEA